MRRLGTRVLGARVDVIDVGINRMTLASTYNPCTGEGCDCLEGLAEELRHER